MTGTIHATVGNGQRETTLKLMGWVGYAKRDLQAGQPLKRSPPASESQYIPARSIDCRSWGVQSRIYKYLHAVASREPRLSYMNERHLNINNDPPQSQRVLVMNT